MWRIYSTPERVEGRINQMEHLCGRWGPQNEVSKGEWGKRLRDREIQKRGCKTNCPRA